GKKAYYRISSVDYSLHETSLSNILTAETKPLTDDEFLNMVEEAHFRYYWDGAEPNSGLARENIPGRSDMIATGASGFGVMAMLVAMERGFISREEGIDRFLKITDFLQKTDKYHGAVSHFMDGTTAKTIPYFGQKDNGGDLVETAFLTQGLLAAHQFFDRNTTEEKTIRERIDTFWRNIEWSWYKQTKDSPFLYWHWSPDQGWIINHPLIGWNETMITYLLAIMSPTHSVEPDMYYSGWASQSQRAQDYRRGWGGTDAGSMYTNGNIYYGLPLKVGVSNGGPLFFIHYSYLGLNPHDFTDKYTNYFENNKTIAQINYRYCVENPGKYVGYGENCWGITASDFAWGYHANEPVISRDNGTIAPTGALASFPYTPSQSMQALRNYYDHYGHFLWGEYGFRDAFNLTENWCSTIFMGLNQAPVTVMIENYRSGFVWDLFMSHPDVQRGIRKINNIEH
ncbi:MAG TPA: glucoamylase family protein, partial [Dysgonamonadaceae bacterium]|nr:glucoamylase family protein [Dysgonamonadaceae bacterium]